MADINHINNEVQKYRSTVQTLGSKIKEAGVNWHDEKYQALSKMIAKISAEAKQVNVLAEKLTNDIKKFEAVSKG